MLVSEALSILLVSTATAGLVAYHWSIGRELRQARKETSRFPMFAVRDELVDLVLDGRMDETDPAWRNLYRGVSHILGMHHELDSLDCLKKYLKRSMEIERDATLKARFTAKRQIEDEAARNNPDFAAARDRAVESFAHIVRRRTTTWHKAVILALYAVAFLVLASFKMGTIMPLRVGRSLMSRRPSSDTLKLWDGPEVVA